MHLRCDNFAVLLVQALFALSGAVAEAADVVNPDVVPTNLTGSTAGLGTDDAASVQARWLSDFYKQGQHDIISIERQEDGQAGDQVNGGPRLSPHQREVVCEFFAASEVDYGEEQLDWAGGHGLCTQDYTETYFEAAAFNCLSCIDGADVCSRPPLLLFHQYLDATQWEAGLLSLKSYLLTQDLRNSYVYLWTSDPRQVLEQNREGAAFLYAFQKHIRFRKVKWGRLIKGTPLEGHSFFGSEARLKKLLPPAAYSDVLRLLLLHKYGGVWIDNDVILMRDWRPLVVNVGYQFVMRWMNNHVLHIRRRSKLSYHLLNFTASIPYSPSTVRKVVSDICEPLGYAPISPAEYGNADVYNGCVLNAGLRFGKPPGTAGTRVTSSRGPGALFEYPLGWFDPAWAQPIEFVDQVEGASGSCLDIRVNLNKELWRNDHGRRYHALHTRWPKVPSSVHHLWPDSALALTIASLNDFFTRCAGMSCVPMRAAFLVDYLQP